MFAHTRDRVMIDLKKQGLLHDLKEVRLPLCEYCVFEKAKKGEIH